MTDFNDSTNVNQNFSQNTKSGSVRSIDLFFFYSLPALNLCPNVFIKLHDSRFKNTKFFSFWGGTSLLRHPPVGPSGHLVLSRRPQNHHKKCRKMDLCPWLGGTCYFEVGEGFGRWCLAGPAQQRGWGGSSSAAPPLFYSYNVSNKRSERNV